MSLTPHQEDLGVLRFITAGSVDDGKSTLIGRLLYDSKSVLTDQLSALARAKHKRTAGEDIDPRPVVKFFTPDAGATWLITEADPTDPDRLFGLCDLGLGEPELGYVSLAEIRSVRGKLGLPVERDLYFTAQHKLSWYAMQARRTGMIVTD